MSLSAELYLASFPPSLPGAVDGSDQFFIEATVQFKHLFIWRAEPKYLRLMSSILLQRRDQLRLRLMGGYADSF